MYESSFKSLGCVPQRTLTCRCSARNALIVPPGAKGVPVILDWKMHFTQVLSQDCSTECHFNIDILRVPFIYTFVFLKLVVGRELRTYCKGESLRHLSMKAVVEAVWQSLPLILSKKKKKILFAFIVPKNSVIFKKNLKSHLGLGSSSVWILWLYSATSALWLWGSYLCCDIGVVTILLIGLLSGPKHAEHCEQCIVRTYYMLNKC